MLILVLFILLLIFSAFFSSSETAYFNIKKHELIDKKVKRLLKTPRKLLTFLLIGNTLVNIGIGTLAANYTINVLSKKFSDISRENLLLLTNLIFSFLSMFNADLKEGSLISS